MTWPDWFYCARDGQKRREMDSCDILRRTFMWLNVLSWRYAWPATCREGGSYQRAVKCVWQTKRDIMDSKGSAWLWLLLAVSQIRRARFFVFAATTTKRVLTAVDRI